ncbi:translocon-associated protein subunit beta-like [Actinia tenebrosa]|uniref:Translocon-associated protein subunit beta n=1 Tax=Actinia tenebrosa TaxID=6105 RepID=A0A6P8IZF9_ACTTE|nr:translocon-associated protein subunit beta-like [Actinia tenebrosa]
MLLLALVLGALVGSSHCADSESSARLIVAKNVLNQFVVENKDLTIHYTIYNVGSSPASAVTLTEDSFPESAFQVVHGLSSIKWKSIAPGTNVSHSIILHPLKSGNFNFTAAKVTYKASEDGPVQVAYSTAPGEGGIMSNKDYQRKHSPHLVDWGLFSLMCIPTLLLPLMIWYRSHSKYENFKVKKN